MTTHEHAPATTGAAGRPPRVLHVAQPTEAGVGRYVAAAAIAQRARGWDVAVACPPDGLLPAELAAAGVTRLHWPAGRSPGAATAGETARLGRLVHAFAPDVLHLHSAKAGLAGRLAVRGAIPTMFQPHGWSWLAAGGALRAATLNWERRAARWTDLYVCVGTGEAAQGGVHGLRGRYAVVRNGVDLRHFTAATAADRASARRAAGVPDGTPLAVCVGRVTRQKGQDVLLAGWPLVRERVPGAELIVVGDGDAVAELAAAAPPGVRFIPGVRDVRPWYAAADVVVLPSRWEGLSLTAIEALAAGRPLIGSDIDGIAEVVTPGVGALVPPEDPVTLAEALTARLESPQLAAAESVTAARYARGFDQADTLDSLCLFTARLARAGGRVRRGTATWPAGRPG